MIVIIKALKIQLLLVAAGVLSIILFTTARPAHSDFPIIVTTSDVSPTPENSATSRLVRPDSSTASYARASRKSIRISLIHVDWEWTRTYSIVSAWGSAATSSFSQGVP